MSNILRRGHRIKLKRIKGFNFFCKIHCFTFNILISEINRFLVQIIIRKPVLKDIVINKLKEYWPSSP